MLEKLKSFIVDDTVFTAALLVMVAIASFGLGQQSEAVSRSKTAEATKKPDISIQGDAFVTQSAFVASSTTRGSLLVIASKSGSKYHLPNCPGAKQIKEANKVEFDSVEAAEAAGYTPAANCPGLQ